MPRPTLLNDELVQKAREVVATGASFDAVAARLGVGRRTLFDWLTRGESISEDAPESEQLYARFAVAVRQGEADFEATMRDKIVGAEGRKGEWSRFSWMLERRFPSRYGAKQRIEHSGPEGGAIQIDAGKILADISRLAGDGPSDSDASEPES